MYTFVGNFTATELRRLIAKCLHCVYMCREHKFVVKGGEDARLDERVEQLFVVMSGLAAEHTGCVSRGLHNSLLTYDVIPATPRLGLLSFVEVRF